MTAKASPQTPQLTSCSDTSSCTLSPSTSSGWSTSFSLVASTSAKEVAIFSKRSDLDFFDLLGDDLCEDILFSPRLDLGTFSSDEFSHFGQSQGFLNKTIFNSEESRVF